MIVIFIVMINDGNEGESIDDDFNENLNNDNYNEYISIDECQKDNNNEYWYENNFIDDEDSEIYDFEYDDEFDEDFGIPIYFEINNDILVMILLIMFIIL